MKINGLEFKIGADPELFVKKFGKLTSAYGLIPGTKEAPFKVKKGAVQVDGMALEFNIDPAETFAQFEDNMTSVMGALTSMVPGYEMFIEPVADFGEEYIESQPDVAKELGCSPDYNAYTKRANPSPDAKAPFRTASGHVHIGWTKEPVDINDEGHLAACRALTKSLDVYLGIPSLLWDTDDRRRALYGKAGAFRPKPYGMEYRVLSNKWIANPLWRQCVYYNTLDAIKKTFEDESFGDRDFWGGTARQIINQEIDKDAWKRSLVSILSYEGVKSPKFYRENKDFVWGA